MKKVFLYLSAAFTIVGGIIGAGFITGREIATFFSAPSYPALFLTLNLFIVFIYIALKFGASGMIAKTIKSISSLSSVIISACMVGALKDIYTMILRQTENIEILLIITVVLSVVMSARGIGYIGKFNLLFMPVSVVAVIVLILPHTDFSAIGILPRNFNGIYMPILYAGMNVFTSFRIFADLGKGKSAKFCLMTALISSVVLVVTVFVLSAVIESNDLYNSDIPILTILNKSGVKFAVMIAICFSGIFSTLICSLYSVFSLYKGKYRVYFVFTLSIFVYYLSRFGFSNIVNDLYPLFGVIGLLSVVTIFLRQFFPKALLKHTLLRQERIK